MIDDGPKVLHEHSVIAGPRARERTMLFKLIVIAGLMVMTTAGVVPNTRAVEPSTAGDNCKAICLGNAKDLVEYYRCSINCPD